MNILEIFEMENLDMVGENQELVNKRLAEREPTMVVALSFAMEGLELYTIGLLEALKEYQAMKNELMNEGSLWYLNSHLSALKKRNNELIKEYKQIRLEVESVCEKALIIAGLKEIV